MKYLCTEKKIYIMNETIILKKSAEIDLNASFIKSLKDDYPEFQTWFNKKSKDGSRTYGIPNISFQIILQFQNFVIPLSP